MASSELVLPAQIQFLFLAFVTLVGLSVGSFLNVVAWRVPQGMSIAWPPSHCPRCGAPIRASDNIPVLAWLALKGRCRVCRGPISPRYAIIEALTGVLSLLFALHDGPRVLLLFHLVYLWALIALALIDLDTWELPFVISLPIIPLAIVSALFDPTRGLKVALVGAGIGWSVIVLVGKVGELLLKKEAMGGGDSWLMASIGAMVGPIPLLLVLFLASVQGVVVGGLMLHLRRPEEGPPEPEPPPPAEPSPAPEAAEGQEPQGGQEEEEWVPDPSAVPFGPFLALGAVEALLWGQKVLHLLHFDLLLPLRP